MPARPAYLRPRLIALVMAGGAVGTLLRHGVAQLVAPVGGVPVATVVVNVAGAFALAWLLTALAGRGQESRTRRDLRLLAGTGLLGAFTTYSALAVDLDVLNLRGHPVLALGYGALTLLGGLAAAHLGVLAAGARRSPHTCMGPDDGRRR
ncbi:fluoride efflux transporter FluC [Nonomuraea gerenzanensis]|uniref:Fluoride-specific ion channel FluC n=1 Tax=Nonomuraea gerenzanensis TaxID=93944 RepID=A0A1M4EDM6_9ACTN|nr:CrcB family protein [Nonomuraea gerenzanensis]UBU08434.1 CrcB family protein [Nonomuraea gerenzanensis]SBO96778.1 CrcB protein [Nonomuraea gerenzanensis]